MVLFLGCRKNPVPRWEACLEWQSMGGMSELHPVVVIFLAHGNPQWETCLEWQYKVMHQTDILVPIMLAPVVHTNYHQSTEFDTTPCLENECETMTDQNLFSTFPQSTSSKAWSKQNLMWASPLNIRHSCCSCEGWSTEQPSHLNSIAWSSKRCTWRAVVWASCSWHSMVDWLVWDASSTHILWSYF